MDNQQLHYTRERLLGQGGMGKVYLAQDNQLQRKVAIKELTYQTTGDGKEEALQEARLLARVNHQNIIQIYNVHDEGDHLALVMEYFNSKTLTQYQHENRCTLLQKVDLLLQLSSGLASAHKSGVIHCDLKPSNILVNSQGQLKVTDFGIALLATKDNQTKESGVEGDSTVETTSFNNLGEVSTESPLLFGSLLYMSPEQIAQQKLDYRSDIFSLGIIAYQLMVGSHPFGKGSANDIAKRICNHQPDNAKHLMLDAPNALTDLLMEMLIQPVEQRTLNASVIENRLTHIKNALVQAEISEQETMPLTSAHGFTPNEVLTQTLAHNQAVTQALTQTVTPTITGYHNYTSTMAYTQALAPQSKQTWFKKYAMLISAIFVCCLSLGIYFGLYNHNVVENKQVVILKPNLVNSDVMAPMQQDLVVSAVEDALRQAVIHTPSMYLIPQREVNAISKAYPDDLQKLQQAVGASDIITTELSCDNNRCKVNFSRLVKASDSQRLSVKSERNWLVPVDKFNAIFTTSQTQFATLFPEETDINQGVLVQRPIKEGDYREYLTLYSKVKGYGNNTKENLVELEQLLTRSPYLYAGYSLYSRAALDLYSDTRDDKYLDYVEAILANSPPEYRYSSYHAINQFGLALHRQDLDSAALQIDEARSRGANDFIIAEREAVLLYFKGEYQNAANAFKRSLELRPSTALLYNLALCYWYMDNLNEAEITLQQMLIIVPDNNKAKGLQANIWLLQGRLESAIKAYESLIEYSYENYDLTNLTNLSLAYSLNGEYLKAYELSKSAYSKSPMHPVNLLNLADLENILHKEIESKLHYQILIDNLKNKEDVQSLTTISQAYAQLKKKTLAVESLTKAQVIAPNSSEVIYTSAIVYSLLEESSSAIHYVKIALKNNIGDAWFNLPWFDELCNSHDFLLLMDKYNNQRCTV